MYWMLKWEKMDDDDAKAAVEQMDRRTRADRMRREGLSGETAPSDGSTESEVDLLIYAPDGNKPSGAPQLVVRQVERKRLFFYPDGWHVYRFTCSTETVPEVADYREEAWFFGIAGPNDGKEAWTSLDWTSSPIRHLNASLEINLSEVEDDIVRDYLLFFASFLGGEPDSRQAISPFLLPSNFAELEWEGGLKPLEEVAKEMHLSFDPDKPIDDSPDPFDLPANQEAPAGPPANAERPTSPQVTDGAASPATRMAEMRDEVTKAFEKLRTNPERDAPVSPTPESWKAHFRALVSYAGALFEANFDVSENGAVEMTDDQPLPNLATLPIPRWEVRRLPTGIHLLCRQEARTALSNEEFLDLIKDHEKNDPNEPLYIRFKRVIDEITLVRHISSKLVFEDVEFVGALIFDDCTFERSVEFKECRLLRHLSVRNATIKGSFVLHGTRIEDAHEEENDLEPDRRSEKSEPPPALALDGLKIERSLLADRLRVHGRITAHWLRLGGALRAHGLQVYGRVDGAKDDPVFDLDHAVIDGPVDLTGHIPRQITFGRVIGRATRTWFGQTLSMVGLKAQSINLSGARIEGSLNLTSSIIAGELTLLPMQPYRSREGWRTWICGSLDLRGLRTGGTVDLGRTYVEGKVRLDNAYIQGNLFASGEGEESTCSVGRFSAEIARIEGHADLRGLEVREGDLIARNIKVDGTLRLATPKNQGGSSNSPDNLYARIICGRIDLEGARASRLVLSSCNIVSKELNRKDPAINLARGRFGQLTVLGFGKPVTVLGFRKPGRRSNFPKPITLTAIEVGDWNIDPTEEALPLLDASEPFDGRNYIDVEERLSRIGLKHIADNVYRAMVWRDVWKSKSPWPLYWRLLKTGFREVFSRQGTKPIWMFWWLFLSVVLVTIFLAEPHNVELAKLERGGHYEVVRDWNLIKASGLAFSYAVPFYGGARAEKVRARLLGPTYAPKWMPWSCLRAPVRSSPERITTTVPTTETKTPCPEPISQWSPHDIAQAVSLLQFILWIFVVANLPTIIRRRK